MLLSAATAAKLQKRDKPKKRIAPKNGLLRSTRTVCTYMTYRGQASFILGTPLLLMCRQYGTDYVYVLIPSSLIYRTAEVLTRVG